MPKRGVTVVIALSLVAQPERAHAAAGFSEICDVERHVVRDFRWSEALHDLCSRSVDVCVPDVSEVAWDDTYIVGKTEAGSWFLIDTRKHGQDAAVEIFPPSSSEWLRRLEGHSFPRWKYTWQLPRPWWAGARCWAVFLFLFAVIFWPVSLLFVGILGAVAVVAIRRRRAARPPLS